MKKEHQPAFRFECTEYVDDFGDNPQPAPATVTYYGMTKREYFAAMAMQAILTGTDTEFGGFYNMEESTKRCYEIADAMLSESHNQTDK